MIDGNIEITVLSNMYILERINDYLAIQETLYVYKKIQKQSFFLYRHSYLFPHL